MGKRSISSFVSHTCCNLNCPWKPAGSACSRESKVSSLSIWAACMFSSFEICRCKRVYIFVFPTGHRYATFGNYINTIHVVAELTLSTVRTIQSLIKTNTTIIVLWFHVNVLELWYLYIYLFKTLLDFLKNKFYLISSRLNWWSSVSGKIKGLSELVINFRLMSRYEEVIFLACQEAFSETNKYPRVLPVTYLFI